MLIKVTQEHIRAGRKNSGCCCPIALALKEQYTDLSFIGVGSVELVCSRVANDDVTLGVALPNNASRSEQWSPDPIKVTGPVCGSVQPKWPSKVCNRKPGHDGDHCEEKQAGTKMISTWWSKG